MARPDHLLMTLVIWGCFASGIALSQEVASGDGKLDDYQLPMLNVGPRDWPQWGGTSIRNNTPVGHGIPIDWEPGEFDRTGEWKRATSRNIKWAARLGTMTYSNPVVANGKVFIGTNNGAGFVPRYPADVDLGCLLCFCEADGQFLWQLSRQKLPTGLKNDWPFIGLTSSPLVDGNRVWIVTNRCEVMCLDTEGFRDGENDGPFVDEAVQADDEADIVWKLDMIGQLGVWPHNMTCCSLTAAGEALFVNTSNGVDESHVNIPAPDAPSFLALDKNTGEVLWTDRSPGRNILHGQWSAPAYAVLGGVAQVIFGGGDGWLYSFDPRGDGQGGSRLLWEFDCNPKQAQGNLFRRRSPRNQIVGYPVIYEGLVYIAVGDDPEHGEADGCLWCIDPTRRGDVSAELVVSQQDRDKPIPRRRLQAVIPEEGEIAIANPNSAAVWHYTEFDWDGDGVIADFEERMHRTCSTATIKNGLLVIPDVCGLVHCLDAKTGKVHWTHDLFAATWASALVVEDKVYLGDEEGTVSIFKLSPEKELISQISMGNSIYTTPVVANDVLYVATRLTLFAIATDGDEAIRGSH